MAKLYRTREGNITAVDTKTQLTTEGSNQAPGPLLVPANAKSLKAVVHAFGTDCSVAADGSLFLRLEGPGLPEGPETLAIGSHGVAVATGGHGSRTGRIVDLDIPVVPSNEILVFAENAGEDVGTETVGVTLIFTS